MKTNGTKRIIIVEDDAIIRNAFVTLIQQNGDYTVANAYDNAEAAIKNINTDAPDICLMDIELPGMNGIEAIPKIKAIKPNTQVVVVTVYENDELVFKALCEGASGYLTKNMPPQKLIESLKELENGGAPMSTNIARMVVESFSKQKKIQNPLTDKENMVLTKLVEGKSYKSVSKELDISIDTVKFHIKNIYLKLQVNCKEDAIDRARENKWL